jgi:hypothetical protein
MAILINDNSARVQYTATTNQTVFTVPFEFFANSDLKVYNGSTLLTFASSPANASQYNVSGAGVTGGGTIALGSPGASLGNIITIVRGVPIERTSDFPLSGPFNIEALNTTLDKMTVMLQDVDTKIEQRVPRLSENDTPNTLSAIPSIDQRKNKLFYWDESGQPSAIDAVGFSSVVAYGSVVVNTFAGNGSTTAFTLSEDPSSINNLIITVNGVTQTPVNDYNIAGLTLTFVVAPPAGTEILARFARALPYNLFESSTGSASIGHISTGSGAVSTTVQAVLRSIAVTPQQYLAAGESLANDAGPAIRRAIASGLPVRFPAATYVVNYDPASAFDDGGATRYSYCVQVPSNTTLIFDQGATIQGKAGLQSWTRIVTFTNSTNFRVFGELKVDANVANRGTPTNEHMHGVFFYNSSDFFVEAIDSRNARGDNVYFGGTDNSRGSCDGYVGRIVARAAGRKNLVWQSFDNLHIASADLDNTGGGAALFGGTADTTDGNCFDVEPDSWTGAIYNRGQIDYLRTKGAGNDFTAGTTSTHADGMIVSIGDWVNEIVPRATVPWHTQYAITLNVNKMLVTGITATSATAELYYGARLNVDQMDIRGNRTDATTPFMIIAYNTAAPIVEINKLSIQGLGVGFENRDGLITIGNYKARTGGAAFWNRGLSGTANVLADVMIDTLDLFDVGQPLGAGYAFLVSITTNAQSCRIGHIRFRDTRATKLNSIASSGSGASSGLFIGTVDNNTTVPLIAYSGTDTFYRVAGGVGTSGDFVVTGTPEAKITAPIGSIARRTDGGASTSFYVKQSGTGNTGWVAK